jgi:arylsulfatase A-like enzyme
MGHYERWLVSRGENEEGLKLWAAETRPGTGAAQTWYSALPVAWHSSTWVGDRAINWLSGRAKSDQPFCAWLSFADPHHAFDCPEPWSLMYDPKDMPLPKHRVRDLERRPWWHKAVLEGRPQLDDPEMLKFRAEGSRVPDQSDRQLAEMTANYYGMISLIDHNVGRILNSLSDLGLAENTLVVYTTDHGELLGNHGLYLKHPIPYEDLLRITMVARGPGVAAGKMVREPVSTLDLASTFYECAGIAQPAALQSRSLRRLLGGDTETRDVAYSEWHVHPSRCGVGLNLRTVRTKTHKCTFDLVSGAGELYDLVNDPAEMDDRFNDPGCAAVQKELHDMMRARPGVVRSDLAEPVGMA